MTKFSPATCRLNSSRISKSVGTIMMIGEHLFHFYTPVTWVMITWHNAMLCKDTQDGSE